MYPEMNMAEYLLTTNTQLSYESKCKLFEMSNKDTKIPGRKHGACVDMLLIKR